METKNYQEVLKKLELVLPDKDETIYNYSPLLGIYPSKINMYTEVIHKMAIVFFSILDKFDLNYVTFAGSSIGLKRCGENMPWVDDYDIMIFEDSIHKFQNEIVPILRLNGFACFEPALKIYFGGGYHVLNYEWKDIPSQVKYFQCDVFYSKYEKDGIVRNLANWGKYNKSRKFTKEIIFPSQRLKFHHDLVLPFMNDIDKEIEFCYGDIYQSCSISTHSLKGEITYNDWREAVADFNSIKQLALENTKERIYLNNAYIGSKNLIVHEDDHQFKDEIQILSYISKEDIGLIETYNSLFLAKFGASIRFFYPEIKMTFHVNEQKINLKQFLNYIDELVVKDESTKNFYQNSDTIYVNTPNIKLFTDQV